MDKLKQVEELEKVCIVCGKKFKTDKFHKNTAKYCSKRCYKKAKGEYPSKKEYMDKYSKNYYSSNKDKTVLVTFEKEEQGAKVLITGPSLNRTEDSESKLSFLAVLMKELQGTIENISLGNEQQSLALYVPMSSAESQPD